MVWQWIKAISPLATTLSSYRRDQFASDLIAGLVVAIMLVPQSMAYAMLAGLPPQVGLYASIVPLILYAMLGTSNSLAVGPVAMVSLLVFAGVGALATPGSPEFIGLCLTLALMIGVLHIAMAVFRLGFLVNFISHPVLVGFTSAAAIVIGFSQVKHLIGVSVESGEYPIQSIISTLSNLGSANLATLGIGVTSCLLLILFGYGLAPLLKQFGVAEVTAETILKLGPLVAVTIAALIVFGGRLDQSHAVKIVGDIPSGLPGLTIPPLTLDAIRSLLPLAFVITLVGYMESISVAKALASRKRQTIDADRELLALGMADVGAAFTGGYPVTGGFSRSLVNDSAGVRTPLGSIFTALFVAISVLFLTPLFYYIPNSVLAAIIIVAVAPLVDFKTPLKLWHFSRSDALALLVTFVAVLATGIETGILLGVVASVVMLMSKMSRPHVAEVGRVGNSEHFRNVDRYDVQMTAGVFAFRIDESLYFANSSFLQSYVMEQVANRPDIQSVLLICSGINEIDATGLDVLKTVHRELNDLGIGFYLSDVKGPVTDRLKLAGVDESFLRENIFMSADAAIQKLSVQAMEA
jgi:SulP family sulfate permease